MKNFKKISLVLLGFLLAFGCQKSDGNTVSTIGISGSLARMIVVNDYLYVIDNKTLSTFNILDASNPILTDKLDLDFGIETLFPFANYIFVGSTDGMYVYDISNPAKPVEASSERLEHVTSCDPVVANEDYAYVTLNTQSPDCSNSGPVNELQIVDISNVLYPELVNIVQLKGPKGLGIDGSHLFICDADVGVIVFDLSIDPENPTVIDTLAGFVANDVIPDNGNLMVVSTDGLRQFNYTDINNITLTSLLDLND